MVYFESIILYVFYFKKLCYWKREDLIYSYSKFLRSQNGQNDYHRKVTLNPLTRGILKIINQQNIYPLSQQVVKDEKEHHASQHCFLPPDTRDLFALS